MSRWRDWVGSRASDPRAVAYVATLHLEPDDDAVRWLTEQGTGGDADHARWELRYARRAAGLLAAQRDALDDQTGSLVAAEMARSLARDPHIASSKRQVAEQQFNARLRAYGDALGRREAGRSMIWQLGRTLLGFAGSRGSASDEVITHAGSLVSRYLADANAALRLHFGAANLPDDIVPSALRTSSR
ncbi:MAG TPA: hypothetical protein VFW98_04415 [Gemmatimonadaceae bacterium]|nr:hypothetical protein [Gemmatimonadaceae bacterium]